MRAINDFKPFVPSNDHAVSKAFYECMGFTVNWDSGDVCEIDTNFENINLAEKFEGTQVAPPYLKPWGLLITHVWDPVGVLSHFAEKPDDNT